LESSGGKHKIRLAIIILLVIILIGISGYIIIEGDTFLDALYMTIITISTVGFGEIHKLSIEGKVFTMFLILSSFGTYAYAISILTSHLVEGKLHYLFTGRLKNKISVSKMHQHVIICGYGRNGQMAARELMAHRQAFVVIENNQTVAAQTQNNGLVFVDGDATQDETLLKANIRQARALITTLPLDADNLYVVLTARTLNPGLKIISRASDEKSEKKLRMAGVDNVVLPEKVGGSHMAILVMRPDIVEFLERLSYHGDSPTNLEEIVCDDLPDHLKNMTIYEIGIRKKSGANILGYKTPAGEYILNPSPDTKVIPGSKIFVLGTSDQIRQMKEILHSSD